MLIRHKKDIQYQNLLDLGVVISKEEGGIDVRVKYTLLTSTPNEIRFISQISALCAFRDVARFRDVSRRFLDYFHDVAKTVAKTSRKHREMWALQFYIEILHLQHVYYSCKLLLLYFAKKKKKNFPTWDSEAEPLQNFINYFLFQFLLSRLIRPSTRTKMISLERCLQRSLVSRGGTTTKSRVRSTSPFRMPRKTSIFLVHLQRRTKKSLMLPCMLQVCIISSISSYFFQTFIMYAEALGLATTENVVAHVVPGCILELGTKSHHSHEAKYVVVKQVCNQIEEE